MRDNIDKHQLNEQLQLLFGVGAQSEYPLAQSGAGVRFTGIDLCHQLSENQVEFLLNALSQLRIVCISGQDLDRFSIAHLERFANYWGAPIPHPNNLLRDGKPAQEDGASEGLIEYIPYKKRRATAINKVFPGQLQCLPHESPTVLVVSNFNESRENVTVGRSCYTNLKGEEVYVTSGGAWHTDIEYEVLPIYVSMFLAHSLPIARDAPGGNWIKIPPNNESKPYPEGSDSKLMQLRKDLPLNGETPYADTAAAFESFSADEQDVLESIQLRRRLNENDKGWLAPLVRTNPRSGIKSLHSPIWASRPGVRPPIEVEGMTMDESRAFLDRLETHVLQPKFRYNHSHTPGDVTIWDNFMTLHNGPPIKTNIDSIVDARLLYRLSCKGEPVLSLPRRDSPDWLASHIAGGYSTPQEILSV